MPNNAMTTINESPTTRSVHCRSRRYRTNCRLSTSSSGRSRMGLARLTGLSRRSYVTPLSTCESFPVRRIQNRFHSVETPAPLNFHTELCQNAD